MKKNKIKKIVFIVADTLRAKNVGVYGAFPSHTPNIDRLAQEGVLFENAFATITKTDPSITSIMSGKYPLSIGLVNHGRDIRRKEEDNISKIKLLPEILKTNNFKTVAIDWLGRWHKRGYDYYSGKIAKDNLDFTFRNLPLLYYLKFIDKATLTLFRRDFFTRFYYSFFSNPQIPYDPANLIVDRAIDLLQNNRSNNLFLYLHFWDAHFPHVQSRGLKSFFSDSVEDIYNSEVNYLDKQLGRLFDFLDIKYKPEELLIVLTADHGENFFGYGRTFNHEYLFDEVVKIPLIIRGGLLPRKKISSLVQHIDILPTVLNLLNIPPQKDLDGKDLTPLILGKKEKVRDFAYFEDILHRTILMTNKNRRRGIRVNDYKYIETLEGKMSDLGELAVPQKIKTYKQELYNLKRDPNEKNDLSKKEKKIVSYLKQQLENLTFSTHLNRLKQNPKLFQKVTKSIKLIKKAISIYGEKNIAIAWKGGKDTTTMMHLIRSVYGEIPFKVFFNDTTLEFDETYRFIEKIKKMWKLDLLVIKHDEKELEEYQMTEDSGRKKELVRLMKITAINKALKKYKFKGFILGIRRDENPARKNEKYFSKRKDHIRIHPLLDWTEEDIWEYIHNFGVPYSPLYDQGYRSVGEKPFTSKSAKGEDERSGRDQEKEKLMVNLRKMGYW